jgi:hypothetical protein
MEDISQWFELNPQVRGLILLVSVLILAVVAVAAYFISKYGIDFLITRLCTLLGDSLCHIFS